MKEDDYRITPNFSREYPMTPEEAFMVARLDEHKADRQKMLQRWEDAWWSYINSGEHIEGIVYGR